MTLPLNPAFALTEAPPVMEARRWVTGRSFPAEKPLINVSQAAPVDSPPLALRQVIAEAALNDPAAHLYGPVLGLPDLRAEIALQWSQAYQGIIRPDQVAITQGCNQAFCATLATLAGPGDEVILPTPWYFNHKMWLDMAGVKTVPLQTGRDDLELRGRQLDAGAPLVGGHRRRHFGLGDRSALAADRRVERHRVARRVRGGEQLLRARLSRRARGARGPCDLDVRERPALGVSDPGTLLEASPPCGRCAALGRHSRTVARMMSR